MAGGVDKIPLRIPREWDPKWFGDFVRDVLALADIRNAQGDGIEITGQSSDIATLTVSQDIQDLLQQTFVLTAPSGFLNFERTLAGESGIVSITDGGANGNVTVSLTANGVNLGKLQQLSNYGVLGLSTGTGNVENIQPDEDGDALAVTAGVIGWTLTPTWGGFHTWLDGTGIKIGTGGDLTASHDGTHTTLNNITGEMRLQASGVTLLAIEQGAVDVRTQFQRSAVITPTQIAANTDNWNPTGLATAAVIRLSTDATRSLTGIVAQPAGTELLLANVGSFDATLVHDATSTAANRFTCPAASNFILSAGESVWIWYDTTSSRWRIGAPQKGTVGGGSARVDVYTANDTWTKQTGAKVVEVICFGAGGGGGAGTKGATNVTRWAGGGGAGGGLSRMIFGAATLGATETVVVGTGGNGASAVTGASTFGPAGSAGGPSSFGSVLKANGGAGGVLGQLAGTNSTPAAAGGTALTSAGGVGGVTGNGTTQVTVASNYAGQGGGSGGSNSNVNAAVAGNDGAPQPIFYNGTVAGGAGGALGGSNGSPGTTLGTNLPGTGGGGGGGSTVGNGGTGGAGGVASGGGGGGSASNAVGNGGAGGNGGNGLVVVITYF